MPQDARERIMANKVAIHTMVISCANRPVDVADVTDAELCVRDDDLDVTFLPALDGTWIVTEWLFKDRWVVWYV